MTFWWPTTGPPTSNSSVCCEYLSVGIVLPDKISHIICTLQTLCRFKSLAYHKGPLDEWTVLTDKGNHSLSIDACTTFVLSKQDPPTTFESFYDRHHEAMSDVKGVSVILFDYKTCIVFVYV